MAEGFLQPLDFYPLAQGHLPGLAPGSLVPGNGLPIWRDMLNLRPHEGQLRFREPVIASALGTPPYSINDATTFARPIWIGEIPIEPLFGSSRYLILTSVDWFIKDGTTWYNITPEHTTGTIASAGTAITGTTTAWLTRGIKVGDLFEAPNGAGNWKVISAVGSDTSITLATSIGVIGAGSTYRIRRTLISSGPSAPVGWLRAHVRILNGNAYVACSVAGGRWIASANIVDGAVLQITGAAVPGATFTGANSIFLTSGERTVETGVDNIGYGIHPLGLEILEDGRLVVPIYWYDRTTGEAGDNRVLYSSHLNLGVWTTSPGGFSDPVQRRSHLTAVGRAGRSLVFHFTDQIRTGEPTGQDDPPLAFPQTSAVIGAAGPQLVCQTSAGQFFVGADRQLYRFDGASTEPLLSAAFDDLLAGYSQRSLNAAILVADEFRKELSLFISDVGSAGSTLTNRTNEVRYNFLNGELTRHSFPFHVHAVSADSLLSSGSSTAANYDFKRSLRQRFFGVASFGNSVASDLVYISSEDPTTTQADSVPNVDNLTAEQPYVETDDLDFGDPHQKKTLERVELWCRAGSSSGAEVVECLAYYEGTTSSITGQAPSVTLATDQETLYTFYFTGNQRAARLWRFRLQMASGDTNFIARMIRMIVYAAPAGDVRSAA